MNRCDRPGSVPDTRLLARAEGSPDADLDRHLEACGDCRARYAALVEQGSALHARLAAATCPPTERLLAFFDLDAGSAAAGDPSLALHLAACPRCQRLETEYRAFMALPATLPGAEPAAANPARQGAGAPADPALASGPGLRQIVARLLDAAGGPGAPAPAALRGGTNEADGPLAWGPFVAGDIVIALAAEPAPVAGGGRVLEGQAEGLPEDAWQARLDPADESSQEPGQRPEPVALVDGGFRFSGVGPGAYLLRLRGSDVEILVPGLRL